MSQIWNKVCLLIIKALTSYKEKKYFRKTEVNQNIIRMESNMTRFQQISSNIMPVKIQVAIC